MSFLKTGIAIHQETEKLHELLTDLYEYHEDRSDINNSGGPNKNMEFARRIEEFLG